MMDFFYDKQIRRLILQATRMFGGLTVITGKGADGSEQLRQVPIRYGDTSRMVNHIIRQNAENKILNAPFMAIHILSINMAPDRRQEPTLVTTNLIDERKFDQETQKYTTKIGNRFTVKRYMPVPYNFTFQLDIWTTNLDQKMQLLEQIMMLFNPSIDLQSSDSPLDWTAITYAEMQDAISWTSKSIPLGTEEVIDVASMQFLIPYWINPPAELSRRRAIETIVANIRAVDELPSDDTDFEWEKGELLKQIIITPGNHVLKVEDTILTLLSENETTVDEEGNLLSWRDLLFKFSDFVEDTSSIIVKRKFGDAAGVSGKIVFHPTNVNELIWTIDISTLPAETLDDITAIIDPTLNSPGDNTLDPAAIGQRYLLVSDLGSPTVGWGTISALAKINDIIEYDGADWIIAFDSAGVVADIQQIITNLFTNKLFRWVPQENLWELAVDGNYNPGTWKVTL